MDGPRHMKFYMPSQCSAPENYLCTIRSVEFYYVHDIAHHNSAHHAKAFGASWITWVEICSPGQVRITSIFHSAENVFTQVET